MTKTRSSSLSMIASMLIFGTIGIFRKHIPLTSGMLAMLRGFIGTAFLLAYVFIRQKDFSFTDIRKKLVPMAISGMLIGVNWILLFEAYRYTSVAVATLCYYMAPVIVILCSPLLGEKITPMGILCAFAAVLGMVLTSGILSPKNAVGEPCGILLGLGAAALYAGVIIMNKRIGEIGAYNKTIVQLFFAAIILLPYNLLTQQTPTSKLSATAVILTIVVGIVHTGIAYALYFGAMNKLSAQSIAIYSYIDPVTAIILSALILSEPFSLTTAIGAVLILGSTLASELIKQ